MGGVLDPCQVCVAPRIRFQTLIDPQHYMRCIQGIGMLTVQRQTWHRGQWFEHLLPLVWAFSSHTVDTDKRMVRPLGNTSRLLSLRSVCW